MAISSMGPTSCISTIAIAMLTWGVILGVNSFPLPPCRVCTRTPSFTNTNVYSSSRRRLRYRLKHQTNALPPSIDNELDTEPKISENETENVSTGQMDSLRRTLFVELEKMRNQFVEMSESLSVAKKREEEAQDSVASLRERQRSVESEKEREINNKKLAFVQEMTDISDQLEGAQDKVRQTIQKTRSEITDIQNQAKEAEGRLRSEIANLEARLELLRREAINASKARDLVAQQTKNEIEDIQAASRKEMKELKSSIFVDRKATKRDNYAQETRIQQAEMDLVGAEKERDIAEEETPKISVLQTALDAMKSRMQPQVAELKERRAANEMFFAVSKKSSQIGLNDEISRAQSEFEIAQSAEQNSLQQTTFNYELKLEMKEKELRNNLRLTNERADRAVADAISVAKRNRIALYQEKFDAVRNQKEEQRNAVYDARMTQDAVRDQYEAELENEIRALEDEKLKAKQLLDDQEQKRENQKWQLSAQIEELTIKLAKQMKEEKEAADEDLSRLRDSKEVELVASRSRTQRALNDIQTTRSNLFLLQDQLAELESVSEEKGAILQVLEDERSSFRKQLKRTAVVAMDKLTLKAYRHKRAQKRK
eukprot:CCRYP_002459-RA/>CCRYP_002459-RA protein AED:0.00 eAED:0.00 QI:117/1/1/1/1/1/2/1253/598